MNAKLTNFTGKISLAVLALVISSSGLALPAASQNLAWGTYVNTRFQYSIKYPVGILIPQGESANGDGQRFVSPDGQAVLTVWGAHNALEQSLAEVFQEAVAGLGGQVTYQVMKPDWFALSGHRQGNIFYQKTYLLGEVYKSFTLEYPAHQRHRFDPLTEAISRSFTGR